jgi:PIN domain nuclease of toxin-antitoxin system
MRFLLDTHIWIWSYLEPQKLSSEVVQELANPDHYRYLSPISIWEMLVLLEKRRIQINQEFDQWFQRSKEDLDLIELPLNWQIVHELRFTVLAQSDPADRFLVATAKVYDLTLVTADEHLVSVPGLRVLQNRC